MTSRQQGEAKRIVLMVEAHLGTHTHTCTFVISQIRQTWALETKYIVGQVCKRAKKGRWQLLWVVVVDMPPMFTGKEFDKLEKPIINCSLTYNFERRQCMFKSLVSFLNIFLIFLYQQEKDSNCFPFKITQNQKFVLVGK